ncbi:MAG: transaldolase family protein [Anaerolineales bacterium]
MARTKLNEVSDLGQSVWLDYLKRDLITSGGLKTYINIGLRGVTSNPSIFEKAIAESDEYDDEIRDLSLQGKDAGEIYRTLAIQDIQLAADALRPVYEENAGGDGYVSLEVSPHLARDTQGTIEAVHELFDAVNRTNVMIKVPATAEGVLAIQQLTAEGININATLMFSLAQYDLVSEAYLKGLEMRAANSYDLHSITSVASFFVSRVDVKVDKILLSGQFDRSEYCQHLAARHSRSVYGPWDCCTNAGERPGPGEVQARRA